MVSEVSIAYLAHVDRLRAESTVRLRQQALLRFEEWATANDPRGVVRTDMLTVPNVEAFYLWLEATGRCRRTAVTYARLVHRMWVWAAGREEYQGLIRYPGALELPRVEISMQGRAPTWLEMDKATLAAVGWYRDLFVVMRFTGLRGGQVMRLRWDDIDMAAATLHIRPSLGKTKAERRGRVVAISEHLVDELAGWGVREGYLIDTARYASETPGAVKTTRAIRWDAASRAWKRTDVPPRVYEGQPAHCFRKGFVSGLAKAGVDERTRKYLVGHKTDVHGDTYAAFMAWESRLRAAVGKVPPLSDTAPRTRGISRLRAQGGE